MFNLLRKKTDMVTADRALPGRATPIPTAKTHFVYGREISPVIPDGMEVAIFGMGCFWGVERMFWTQPGVWLTMVGYAAGYTPNPTYEEVCTGMTGHNEVVLVVYEPARIVYGSLLRIFWENHDPTQGMRQGNDIGTQYRSGIYCADADQIRAATASRDAFAVALRDAGYGAVTTEILTMPAFYYAEAYHQQYLARNPNGYCGLGGTGVACQVGADMRDGQRD